MAARHFNVPIALVSLVDENRLWFKAAHGLSAQETSRQGTFCERAINSSEVFVVLDAAKDTRFNHHPLVTGELKTRFYAGAPLINSNGFALGTLCLVDSKPRTTFSKDDIALLAGLADIVIDHIEMLYSPRAKIENNRQFINSVLDNTQDGIIACDNDAKLSLFNHAARKMHGMSLKSIQSEEWSAEYSLYEADGVTPLDMDKIPLLRALKGELVEGQEMVIAPKGQPIRTVLATASLMRDENGKKIGAIVTLHDITQKRKSEADVASLDAKYRAIFDHTAQFCVLLDSQGRVLEVNQTAQKFGGFSSAEVRGKLIWEMPWVPKDRKSSLIEVLKMASSGKLLRGETYLKGSGGEQIPIDFSISPVWDINGKIINLIAEGRDVSAKRRAEDGLRRNQAELELIFNNIPMFIFYKDDKNTILRANEPAARSLKRTVKEVEGQNTYDLYPAFAKKYHDDDLKVIQSGRPKLGIVEEFHTDVGTRGWVRTDKVPYTDPETGNRFVFVASTDITAEKTAELALLEKETQYRKLYNSTPVMLYSTDLNGNIVSISDYFLKRVGYNRSEVIGQKTTDFLARKSAKFVKKFRDTAFSSPTGFEGIELQIVTKSGETIDVLMTAVAQSDEDGKMVSLLAVLTDVTERKLVEQQLRQAQKMESVGQLTGGLAHDFNNLLGVVLGNLQLIERSISSDEKTIRRLSAATDAVERGAELTRRLLAFSRKQKLETEAVDTAALISGMRKLMVTLLGEGIELECILSDQNPQIRTDPVQLESALLNLAVNARDAMPDGGHLTIETKMVEFDDESVSHDHDVSPGHYIMIAVTDTGEGIAEDKLQNVFEPFFTTKDVGRGSGLGLSMVYGFTKQSGGHARIYSELNHGTTVRLYLPVNVQAIEPKTNNVHDSKAEVVLGRGQLILVVEDQLEVREIAAGLLEDLGYRVITADCGKNALEVLASRDDIELIFTDMVMPGGIDGAELAHRVRRVHPNMPTVFTTGYADAAVLREGKITKSSNLVTKPYRRSELAEKMSYALAGIEPLTLNRDT